MTAATEELEPTAARLRLLQRGRRLIFPVPDMLLAVLLGAAALVDFIPPERLTFVPTAFFSAREELFLVLMVEGGFLMMQAALVDIATRLKKRPPIWAIPIILGGLALFAQNSFELIQAAWQQGMLVFIPLLLSLAERGTMLWTMPVRSRVEKIAARALMGNRITTGLGLGFLMLAVLIAGVVAIDGFEFSSAGSWPGLAAGAIYFAIAAFDDWRVRGRRFAEKPTVLFGFDPMHIDYLEPV